MPAYRTCKITILCKIYPIIRMLPFMPQLSTDCMQLTGFVNPIARRIGVFCYTCKPSNCMPGHVAISLHIAIQVACYIARYISTSMYIYTMHGSFQGFVISCACRVVYMPIYSLLNSTFAEVMQMSFCVQPIVWVVKKIYYRY